MYCRKCGKQFEDGAGFCPYCGNPSDDVPQQNVQNPNNPYPYGQPVQMAYAQQPHQSHTALIVVIAVAVIICIGVVLYFVFKNPPGETYKSGTTQGTTDKGGDENDDNNMVKFNMTVRKNKNKIMLKDSIGVYIDSVDEDGWLFEAPNGEPVSYEITATPGNHILYFVYLGDTSKYAKEKIYVEASKDYNYQIEVNTSVNPAGEVRVKRVQE